MQTNDTPLDFLRDRIREIKVALFSAEINSELSLPNNIIQTISTDADGHVYFFTSCNHTYAKQIDRSFYAYLDYHRKGTDVRLRLSGKAVIVNNEEESAAPENEEHGIRSRSIVLVKMKIMQAEYFGPQELQRVSRVQRLYSSINNFFFPPETEQRFNFS